MDRRFFLKGLIAAPAIVAFNNIMPVKVMPADLMVADDLTEASLENLLVKCYEKYSYGYVDKRVFGAVQMMLDAEAFASYPNFLHLPKAIEHSIASFEIVT